MISYETMSIILDSTRSNLIKRDQYTEHRHCVTCDYEYMQDSRDGRILGFCKCGNPESFVERLQRVFRDEELW